MELSFSKIIVRQQIPGKQKANGDWLKNPVLRLQVNFQHALPNNVAWHKIAEHLIFVKAKNLRGDLGICWELHAIDKRIGDTTFIEWKKSGAIFGFKVNKRAKYILWMEAALAHGAAEVRDHVSSMSRKLGFT